MRHRKDSNHDKIEKTIRAIPGFVAFNTSQMGEGFPDLVVGGLHQKTGDRIVVLVEIKTEKGKLRDGQAKFLQDWEGLAYECRTIADVLVYGFGWDAEEAKIFDAN